MVALVVLVASAVVPLTMCALIGAIAAALCPSNQYARARRMRPFRKGMVAAGVVCLACAWVGGALAIEPLAPRFSGVAALWFASVCFCLCLISCAFSYFDVRTGLPRWELLRRCLRWCAALIVPLAITYGAAAGLHALIRPDDLTTEVLVAMSAGFAALLVLLYIQIPLTLAFFALGPGPARVHEAAEHVARQRQLPPYGVWRMPALKHDALHMAALPWLRVVLVTDELAERLDDDQTEALLRLECYGESESPRDGALRWTAVLVSCAALTAAAWLLSADDRTLFVASLGCLWPAFNLLLWFANRQSAAHRARLLATMEAAPGPLAEALRRLPRLSQTAPITSRQPVRANVYEYLLGLGFEPGPPPPRHT